LVEALLAAPGLDNDGILSPATAHRWSTQAQDAPPFRSGYPHLPANQPGLETQALA
jgi:hypothetical protein